MPVPMGQKANFESGGLIVKLKEVGQQVHFRILSDPEVDGKHWFEKDAVDGKRQFEVFSCSRIMNATRCEYCDKFFKAKRAIKDIKEAGQEVAKAQEIKDLEKEAKHFQVTEFWYYPALDRKTERAILLRLTPGIRRKIDAKVNAGEDVMNTDYKVIVTDGKGVARYTFDPVDSAKTPEITDKEQAEIKQTLRWDLLAIINPPKKAESEKAGDELRTKEDIDKAFPDQNKVVDETNVTEEAIDDDDKIDPEDVPF